VITININIDPKLQVNYLRNNPKYRIFVAYFLAYFLVISNYLKIFSKVDIPNFLNIFLPVHAFP